MLSATWRRVVASAVLLVLAGLWAPAGARDVAENPDDTIGFDLSGLDTAGLYGPPNGLRALAYEFCIPDRAHAIARVQTIDASVRMSRSPGRVGCRPGQLLCIGSTHQSGYREVLAALARLTFVVRIEQAHFE